MLSCVKTEKLDQGIFEMTEKLLENYDTIVKKDDKLSALNMNFNSNLIHHVSNVKEKKTKEVKELKEIKEIEKSMKNNIGFKSSAKSPNPMSRDNLYSEKFYSKNTRNEDDKKKSSNKTVLNTAQQIILPKLFDLKYIFN